MPKQAGWAARGLLLALAVASAGCAGGPGSSASFERSLSVSGPLRLELVNRSGSARISAGDAGQVRIRGEVRARGWVPGDVRRRVEEIASNPPIERQGNLIRVGSGRTRDLMRSMTLNYTIVVPPETELETEVGSGGITIAEPGGRVTAGTGSGSVTVSGAAADLRAKTGSGNLTIEGNPSPDSYWELHTGSGGIAIAVPASASFRFHAHSNSGQIETHIPVVIEERSKHELRARVGSGAARVEAETGSGNIQIR